MSTLCQALSKVDFDVVERGTGESGLSELIYYCSIWKGIDRGKTGIWCCFIITLESAACLMRGCKCGGLGNKFVDLSATCQCRSVKER